MGDTKQTTGESVKDDCRESRESEDEQTEHSVNNSVRPKEYLVPPYVKDNQRDTRSCKTSHGEGNQQQPGGQTNLQLTKLLDGRLVVDGGHRRFGSPRITTHPKATFKTCSTQWKTTKYMNAIATPLSKRYLEELDREPPDTIAEVFHKRHDEFVKVLKTCSKDKSRIEILFSVLSKITKSEGDHLIHFSSVLRESLFIENIAVPYLLSLIGRGSDNIDTIRHAICILRYIIEHSYTSVTSFLGICTVLFDLSREIRSSDLCTPEIKTELDEFEHVRSKINTIRLRQRKKVRTKEDKMLPPDSFRLVNISPTADELLTDRTPFLRKNKDIGSYNDLEHYLDVQFRLLREDFVAPLRESINDFKNNMDFVHDGSRKAKDIRVYSGVKITGTTTSHAGICHVLTFNASKTQRVKWEFSKRLLYGSLLCLSYDRFQTIYFATVTQRDPSDLELGMVDVQFTCELETVRSIADKEFVMAESATYFEAYKHNLSALQLIEDLPFSQYIVECRDDIKPPAYLMKAKEKRFDLSMLNNNFVDDKNTPFKRFGFRNAIKSDQMLDLEERKCDKTLENIDVLNDRSWPSCSKLGLDESQHRALKNALTHEFSITQGPPGTGKTFIGLKVARALLANKALWSDGQKQPFLVVCYTNHALDQFLCGIHSFFKGDIVRIGGRSANDEMQKHGIKTMYKNITLDAKEASAAAREAAEGTENRINQLKRQLYRLDREIVMTEDLLKYMGHFQKPLEEGFDQRLRNISNRNCSEQQKLNLVREWLGHGVLLSNSDIRVHFAGENLDIHTPSHELKMTRNRNPTSNDTKLSVDSRYYEQVGCISKDNIHLSLLFCYATRKQRKVKQSVTTDMPNTVAYQDIEPMNEKSRNSIRKIWKLRFPERWELYKSWVEDLKHDLTESLKEYEDNFLECCQSIKRAEREKQVEALRQADVIGMTTTGAAKHYEVLQSIKPKIVIVEEAAEVLEGHIVTSLSDECEHLILIGDHKQLRPSPTVYELAKKYKLDLSLFERMINNKVNHEKLEIQHRMRPEIADIIRLIYPYLTDHEIVLNKQDIRGISKNVYFVTHNHAEEEEEDTLSHLNKHEAEFVVGLCRYLLKQEYEASQITVLTSYRAQMFYLQKLMPTKSVFAGVNITVVDNYQGEENEIVILSLVRSNSSKKVGFLKTENRINVALSRARNGLYVIGNMENFADVSDTWAKIVSLLQAKEQIGSYIPLFCRNHPDTKLCAQLRPDFDNAPEGGCNLNCEARLDCGHVCELKCHVYDTDHKAYFCKKQCVRVCQNGHPCFKKCFERCDDCQVPVVKTMPNCGHEQTMPCFQCPLEWDCIAPCDKCCDNGHQCKKKCYEECGNCLVEVVRTIPKCGHEQKMPCFKDPLEWKCQGDCGRICENCHKCNKMCYENCEQCDVIYQRRLTKCGHDQLIPCFMAESEWKCNAYCERKCKNNHEYRGLCSGECTIGILKEMEGCGHLQTVQCNVESNDWQCNDPCDGKLKCGHDCPSLCSDTSNHNSHCMKVKSQPLKVKSKPKGLSLSSFFHNDNCEKDCEFVLECGHKCSRKCYQPHETLCFKKITIQLEKCGHSFEIECYKQKGPTALFKCLGPCEHILECGHKCQKKCYEPHTTTCGEFVLKGKSCGHTYSIACHVDVESVLCMKPCEFRLQCGHQCGRRCSEPHTEVCIVEIEKSLPCCGRTVRLQCMEQNETIECPFPCEEKLECGHSCTNKCGDPHTSDCQVITDKTLSCGHVQKLQCGVNAGSIKCFLQCKTVLRCGHGCKNRCIEPHTSECSEIVNYKCDYGHKTTAPCHRIYTEQGTKCHHKCSKKLACGHMCSGTCFECRGGVLHNVCSACPLPDLKNHIYNQAARDGVPCLAKCQNKCDHRVCEKMCFEPCAEVNEVKWPCEEKCNAVCEHFNCQKRTFEHQKAEFCTDAYEIIASIAENMSKPRDLKRRAEITKSHRSCGALIDASIIEAALKRHVKNRHRKSKEINEATCLKIADKLHEYEEKEKRSSQFYVNHTRLHERLLSLESMLDAMDQTTDLYKIYKCRLEYNRENFKNWVHFQRQGYRDLEKEINRLERMARTILSI